jgi:hypothetical protein
MEHSATYLAVCKMMEHGLLVMTFPDLIMTLDLLETKGLITGAEHKDLLELAEKVCKHLVFN